MQGAEKKITLKKAGSWVRETYSKEKIFMVSLDSSIHFIFCWVFLCVCVGCFLNRIRMNLSK